MAFKQPMGEMAAAKKSPKAPAPKKKYGSASIASVRNALKKPKSAPSESMEEDEENC